MNNIDCAPKYQKICQLRLIVLLPEEDEAGMAWEQGVAKEWADDLADTRQDIYSLQDGQPVNEPR
jgi:hypothetical protein